MLSKTWFAALALTSACRLGTPRPDGAEGPTGPAAPAASVSVAAPPPAAAPSEPPALLTLPGVEGSPEPRADPPPAPAPAAARQHRVVVLGDSLSDPRVGGGGYLQALLRGCADARVENLAKGGWMVNQMRRRFEAEVLPRLPADFDELIVFGGVNDLYSDETAGRTFAKVSSDLAQIYRGAKARGVRVIALTVTPWGGFTRYYNPRRAAATRQLNDWIKEQERAGLIDVVVDANPLLSCGDAERLCPEYERPFHDGIHFGKVGQQRLGAELVERAFADCGNRAKGSSTLGP